jgi:hypothetical protein
MAASPPWTPLHKLGIKHGSTVLYEPVDVSTRTPTPLDAAGVMRDQTELRDGKRDDENVFVAEELLLEEAWTDEGGEEANEDNDSDDDNVTLEPLSMQRAKSYWVLGNAQIGARQTKKIDEVSARCCFCSSRV